MSRLSALAKGAGKLVTDNSPAILTAVAVAGVATTAIMAVKVTPRAIQVIQEAESEHVDPITPKQKIQLCWQLYVPSAAVGAATIACIIGAQTINTKRNAALVSAYSLTEAAFQEYQKKVMEHLGETKEQKVRDEVAQEMVDRTPPTEGNVFVTNQGDVLFLDTFTGQYFRSTVEKVRKAQNDVNGEVIDNMYASQNEFLTKLGLPPIGMGDEFGWTNENRLDISFSTAMSDKNEPCITITYRMDPIRNYWKGHS